MNSFTDIYFKMGEYKLVRSSYLNNGYLAVVAFSNTGECIGSVTVNIKGDKLEKNEAYLDENNLPGIGTILERDGYATRTGFCEYSGFCEYPKFKFNLDKLLTSQSQNGSM